MYWRVNCCQSRLRSTRDQPGSKPVVNQPQQRGHQKKKKENTEKGKRRKRKRRTEQSINVKNKQRIKENNKRDSLE